MLLLLLLSIGFVAASPSFASAGTSDSSAPPDTSHWGVVALPILFYTPETRIGAGAMAVLHHRSGGDPDARPSTLTPVLLYTQEGQVVAQFGGELSGAGNRWAIEGAFGFRDFPTRFWGVGSDTPDADEEDWTHRAWTATGNWKRILKGRLRGGIGFDLEDWAVRDIEAGGQLASGMIPGSRGGRLVGAGAILDWDSRDNLFAARSGQFHRVIALVHRDAWGSGRDFETVRADLRAYGGSEGRGVLAVQGIASATRGDVPFRRLPTIGGSSVLRGYYEGRYLDRHAAVVQVEYRSPFRWRHGIVVHAAIGGVAGSARAFRADELVTSGGLGVRWAWDRKERVHLRIDAGFGSKGSAIYMDLGEAF